AAALALTGQDRTGGGSDRCWTAGGPPDGAPPRCCTRSITIPTGLVSIGATRCAEPGARSAASLLGSRLRPWWGRHDELPAHLHGVRGDYQDEQARKLAAHTAEPNDARDRVAPAHTPIASARHRAALRVLWRYLTDPVPSRRLG
ncbi:MAG: hypothetical protein JWO67_4261, partial [Streptosporangiaceae bacterium]|nr:hypothetical protein [Streptosporangiaceae bacterium]